MLFSSTVLLVGVYAIPAGVFPTPFERITLSPHIQNIRPFIKKVAIDIARGTALGFAAKQIIVYADQLNPGPKAMRFEIPQKLKFLEPAELQCLNAGLVGAACAINVYKQQLALDQHFPAKALEWTLDSLRE